jgi:hypothetical protein
MNNIYFGIILTPWKNQRSKKYGFAKNKNKKTDLSL